MTIDSYSVRLSTSAIAIENPLEIGSDVVLQVQGTVTQVTDKDNQDGTVERIYTVKGEVVENI